MAGNVTAVNNKEDSLGSSPTICRDPSKCSSLSSCVLATEQCNRAQFWGAVGIFVEKPHILNRRLCGVADVWWGVVRRPRKSTDNNCSVDVSYRNKDTVSMEVDEAFKNSESTSLVDDMVWLANELLSSTFTEGEMKEVRKENDQQDSSEEKETKINTSEEVLIAELKSLFKTKGFMDVNIEDGERVQPWHSLTQHCRDLFVVVRHAVPKQTHRFATTLEVILLDGLQDSASFLSSSSGSHTPPLLPSLSYHLEHRCGAVQLRHEEINSEDSPSYPVSTDAASGVTASVDGDGTGTAGIGNCLNGAVTAGTSTGGATSIDARADYSGTACTLSSINGASTVSGTGSDSHEGTSTVTSTCAAAGSCMGGSSNGVPWLRETVLPRVARWASQISETGETGSGGSLNLVDLQAYSALYSRLKDKYAQQLIQSWPERTDPHKFVHEDLGIATYLLLLWRALPRPQRFLDLGCGNGLLVYILSGEGHTGQGFDLKRRGIWDTFPSNIDLQEREVLPCDSSLPRDVDWLLGNHSDELTPWIPVMAARSSYTCSFFVLPCCPHDFSAKFLRRRSGLSQYAEYLDYVEKVGAVCGFNVERDRLKIPSTKRVCFVGRTRTHSLELWPQVLNQVHEFIDQRVALYVNHQPAKDTDLVVPVTSTFSTSNICSSATTESSSSSTTAISSAAQHSETSTCDSSSPAASNNPWTACFVARPKEQRTRNCTQLKREVKEDLVRAVVDIILGHSTNDNKEFGLGWRGGERTELRVVAEGLGALRLQQLKQECGGLQTLCRNHRHIFQVEKGTVKLRSPGVLSEGEEQQQRPCWFFSNHPQGCPNTDTTCFYNHHNRT